MGGDAGKVLVTGATGFLGHSLVPYLLAANYGVRALVRSGSDDRWLADLGVELASGDVREPTTVEKAMRGIRSVVHAAGLFRFWGPDEKFEQTNVDGTAHVVAAAVKEGVERFVHVSTVAVVGKPQPGTTIDETHVLNPQDPYQHSKVRGEEKARDAFERYQLPAVIVRPGAFYGPWGRYAFNRLFFEDPLSGLYVRVNRGRYFTFPAYIEDAARGIIAALERGRPGEIYNLSGESITHREANAVVSRLAGISSFRLNVPAPLLIALGWGLTRRADLFTQREPFYPLNLADYVFADWIVSSDKAASELGFESVPFEEGVRRTLAWYRDIGIWRGPRQPWEAEREDD